MSKTILTSFSAATFVCLGAIAAWAVSPVAPTHQLADDVAPVTSTVHGDGFGTAILDLSEGGTAEALTIGDDEILFGPAIRGPGAALHYADGEGWGVGDPWEAMKVVNRDVEVVFTIHQGCDGHVGEAEECSK